ncbi:hypothetical protein PFICI_07846 [Pestalotiopsis fici W106-1]|uniref:Oxidoreductase n=1 Tax=Pestalotiopsis fici (strain W106-1 / CGMCC3.15140) TaxID=1229662 RepID=W3X4L1_PESFW|nr:uncharacterized protein PFICI_07846 [Pestalotiopsis fici W106-1]ETS80317.1 hypothetical protein PFICI_07846 [Pestalotiopsis fici W106-1]
MFGAAKFKPDRDIPDLRGRVIFITGGSDGLGKESAKQFARYGATVYIGARNREKASAAIAEIKASLGLAVHRSEEQTVANIHFIELDLASLDSVAKAAQSFRAANNRLDILMNNGGIMATPEGLTKDGYEIQFGTNHVGHALLTKLLLPVLEATATMNGGDVRIVNVTSIAQEWFGPPNGLLLEEAKTTMGGIGPWQRYGHSKIANVYFTKGLSKRYPGIRSVAVHPGGTKTSLSKGVEPTQPALVQAFMDLIKRFTFADVAEGAYNQLWASTSPEAKSGLLHYPVAKEHIERTILKDEGVADKLWDWTEKELRRLEIF